MKKLMVVFLSLALVLGLSTISMAALALDSAQLEVGVTIEPNAHMAIVTNDFDGATTGEQLKGLFNHGFSITGDPGFYISDGNATKNFAVSQWNPDPNTPVNLFDDDSVEMIAIDANTDVRLTMSSDFDTWPAEVPLFFRLSSDAGLDDQYNDSLLPAGFVNNNEITGSALNFNTITQQGSLDRASLGIYTGAGFGDWYNNLAVIANDDSAVLNMNDGLGQSDSVDLHFRQCTPYLIHVNGGLYLDKVGVVQAGDYYVTIDFVVEAM